MDRKSIENGIFKSGNVIEQTLNVIEQDFGMFGALLTSELDTQPNVKFSRQSFKRSCGITAGARLRSNVCEVGSKQFRICCDVVLGTQFRFFKELNRPCLIWQLLKKNRRTQEPKGFELLTLPVMDSDIEECEPKVWLSRTRDGKNYTHFIKDENGQKTLIFLTGLIGENVNSTLLSDNEFALFLQFNLEKLLGENYRADHAAFEKHCVSLIWDEEQEIYHPAV